MSILWQLQPYPTACGQTCVAMLLGIPVAEVIAHLGRKATTAKELTSFLRAMGWKADERCRSARTMKDANITALCRVRWGDPKSRKAHWVLLCDRQFWDPLSKQPIFCRKGGRVLSYVQVQKVCQYCGDPVAPQHNTCTVCADERGP